ncbi:plasmid transfer protein [Pontibacter diazotrophicus]|uniref:Plasmid transfer protein n=1 Tax=Pontibacter diazotrophicus TaxID=1400979 RepID=A0A3D8L3Q0_9BACT|nr:plasmid transfer protein [Pontibacter diazotrophicus]RDV11887.1 plasmid transfer protein [Pontibacter diazotrophicus]
MRKYLYLISALTFGWTASQAQQLVFDPAVVSTLVVNHTAQQEALKDIKDSEGKIFAAQQAITVKMAQIKELEEKMYNSLKSVQSIVGQSKNIVYASSIAQDIGKYQAQMMDIAQGDPELLLIAAKTELALVNRSADLFAYIYQVAVIGTDVNLMSNADRLNLIRHVVDELRVMRGLSYSITQKMRVAKHAGLIRTMNPLGLKYPDNSQAIIQSLMEEYKTIKK